MKNDSSAKGARTKHEQVKTRAKARRDDRISSGQEPVQPRSRKALEAAARELLATHRVVVNPATLRIAKLHEQMIDAVDAVYETAVKGGKEQRQISAMVSAGKLIVSTLNILGLPGDELEDEAAAAAEQRVEARKDAKASKKKIFEDEPDDLEAFE